MLRLDTQLRDFDARQVPAQARRLASSAELGGDLCRPPCLARGLLEQPQGRPALRAFRIVQQQDLVSGLR